MEKLANKITNKLALELNFDEEKRQVVNYGLYGLIQLITILFSTLILGLIFGIAIEALMMSFTGSLLRKYSGGAHVSDINVCTLISILICILFPLIIKFYLLSLINSSLLSFLIAFIFLSSFYIVYKFAPVDNPNKPIKTEKKKKRMRKGSFICLILFLLTSVLFSIFGRDNKMLYAFCLSILFAVSWQIFTLTKAGLWLYKALDAILYKIALQRR